MPDTQGQDLLDWLRDRQDRESPRANRMSFEEWSREKEFQKTRGTPIGSGSGYSPGFGMMGHLNTSSHIGRDPNRSTGGNPGVGLKYNPGQQFGVPSGGSPRQDASKYNDMRLNQPTPWIDDVNMSGTWYSPMEPVWPFGPPYYNVPREWNFPVGYNLNFVPERMGLYQTLRQMRQTWGVLATVESTRMDQLLRIPWTIQRKDKPRQSSAGVDQMRRFFRRPDGKQSFGQWTRRLLFDLFDIDAPAIFMARDGRGQISHAECLDGATIFPLIDDTGRRPDSDYVIDSDGYIDYSRRQPAYQQIIYGLPMVNLSEDELMYPMLRPRPELPIFGYSPIEQVMLETMEAIRKTIYQLEFWRSGSMPELIITVPDAWTPRQIAMFQAHFDAVLAGNLVQKSQVRFVPGGMKPFDIKNASGESLWSQRDETLIRLICYSFSVSPTPFVRQTNRSTAQNAQQTAQEEGLYPLMSWFKDDVMDTIIQEKFGFEDLEFVFQPRPEADLEKAAKIHDTKIKNGEISRNEARAEDGLEPILGGDVHTIEIGNAVIPVELAAKGQAMPIAGFGGGGTPQAGSKPGKSKNSRQSAPNASPMTGPARPIADSPIPPTPVHKKAGYKDVNIAASMARRHPTKGQRDEGNYQKGHVWIQGLDVTIEQAVGSKRRMRDEAGNKHNVKMPAVYGYVRGFIGADNEHMDVYIGKHPKSNTVWVIDQDKVTTSGANTGFDEHKCMIGYKKLKPAIKDYSASHFDGRGHERIHDVVEMPMKEFKTFLQQGNLHKPAASQRFGTVVLAQADLTKTDTISQALGLLWHDQTSAKAPKPKRKSRLRLPKSARPKRPGPRFLHLTSS